ncbi:hypothetical protein HGA64_05710, partial [Candidatus Falkowbacteria bacterium]|nr:hypothetical protein [Candidatus Falkowbacteria bacterium]
AAMKLFPPLRKKYTNENHEGQIYIPMINWGLFVGCVLLVLYFKSSSSLASAYGLAVSGDMLATSLAMIFITQYLWKWKRWQALCVFAPLAILDSFFFLSNSTKFFQGGFIPLAIGVTLYFFMTTWQWGQRAINRSNDAVHKMNIEELVRLSEKKHAEIPKTVIFLSRKFTKSPTQFVPIIFQVFWARFRAMPRNIIFLHVTIERSPHMQHRRFEIVTFKKGKNNKGSIVSVKVNFGYWEKPNVENVLDELAQHKMIKIKDDHREWLLYMLQERVYPAKRRISLLRRWRINAFQILLRNADHKDHLFGLGHDIGLSAETLPIYLD